MKIRLWNKTKQSWIRDADSDNFSICEFDSYVDAIQALNKVNELKKLNPHNENDDIVLELFTSWEGGEDTTCQKLI